MLAESTFLQSPQDFDPRMTLFLLFREGADLLVTDEARPFFIGLPGERARQ
jgi:hypothetical protein